MPSQRRNLSSLPSYAGDYNAACTSATIPEGLLPHAPVASRSSPSNYPNESRIRSSCARRSAKSFSRCRCSSTTAAGALATKFSVRQFLSHRHQLGFHLRDLLAEALTLGLEIDQAFQREKKFAQRRQRGRRSFRRLVIRRSSSRSALSRMRRTAASSSGQRDRRLEDKRNALVRSDVEIAPQPRARR